LSHDILIFGASCRAAAFSALRSGLRPRCADYFADRDLAALCEVDRIDSLQSRSGFTSLADSLAPSTWFYTGGFENHPAWVEQITQKHRLWGASARTLRNVRDPLKVATLLHEHDIPAPAVRRDQHGLPRDGTWLIKPLRSGGGRDIRPLNAETDRAAPSCYFQQWIDGPSYSALYIVYREDARLVGVTQQLLGVAGSPYIYRGSIGPWPISDALAIKLRRLGEAVARGFGIPGWFGIDFVLRDNEPWPVEVNPRYTASVEIHELASRRALMLEHRRACEGESACASVEVPPPPMPGWPRVIGKQIVYAPRKLIAPEITVADDVVSDPFALRPFADVPWPGTRFAAGEPVMTLFAWGDDVASCQSRLSVLEKEWIERLAFMRG
jgi:predicted ATP-grasp superfamily ATP-dependent carboligase